MDFSSAVRSCCMHDYTMLPDVIKTASMELADIMDRLPRDLLLALVMANAEGKSSHEIAILLNNTEMEVDKRIRQALDFCKMRLQCRRAFQELTKYLYN